MYKKTFRTALSTVIIRECNTEQKMFKIIDNGQVRFVPEEEKNEIVKSLKEQGFK